MDNNSWLKRETTYTHMQFDNQKKANAQATIFILLKFYHSSSMSLVKIQIF